MKRWIVVVYFLAAVSSAPLIYGMVLALFQHASSMQRAENWYRRDAGASAFVSIGLAAAWPIGLPLAYLITGFAEHGFQYGRRER